MSTSYDQTPGTLNLSLVRGDDFSALIDLSISIVSYAVTAEVTSLVTGAQVVPFTVTIPSAANGQINIALTDTQTAAIPRGTYGWNLKWTENAATRTALTGYVEVL